MSHVPASEMEASSNALPGIVELHATEASLVWALRDTYARSPAYDLRALTMLDDRLDAHLDGLRIAGDFGAQLARAALRHSFGGEAFVAAWLAIERSDTIGLAEVLRIAVGSSPDRAGQVRGALAWVPLARVRHVLHDLLSDECPPELNALGIAGCAAHRYDPGSALGAFARAADTALAARTFRAIGEIGRADLLPDLLDGIGAADEARRFWAASSIALLSETERPRAVEVLWRVVDEGGPRAERACSLAARMGDPALIGARLRDLPASRAHRRAALAGAAALGDPALIPWILERMALPEDARLAGWAFSMVTGFDLIAHKLVGQPPPGFISSPNDDPADERVRMSPDEPLPWPDHAAALAFWRARGSELRPGARHLLGKPVEASWLSHILRVGSQPSRESAAIELRLADATSARPLFNVLAPGRRQQRILGESEVNPCGR